MSVSDRLHEKAERRRAIVVACRKRASNELASALGENARLLDLLADCDLMIERILNYQQPYRDESGEWMTVRSRCLPLIWGEDFDALRGRIEEVSRG